MKGQESETETDETTSGRNYVTLTDGCQETRKGGLLFDALQRKEGESACKVINRALDKSCWPKYFCFILDGFVRLCFRKVPSVASPSLSIVFIPFPKNLHDSLKLTNRISVILQIPVNENFQFRSVHVKVFLKIMFSFFRLVHKNSHFCVTLNKTFFFFTNHSNSNSFCVTIQRKSYWKSAI